MASHKVSIANETRGKIPHVDFVSIKRSILGDSYTLNVIITSPTKIKKLNTIYRNKTVATDILSFPLTKNEGEIYICPAEARKQAKDFDRKYENFLSFLFIHGCVHLKGYDHGCRMEGIEAKFRKQFGI